MRPWTTVMTLWLLWGGIAGLDRIRYLQGEGRVGTVQKMYVPDIGEHCQSLEPKSSLEWHYDGSVMHYRCARFGQTDANVWPFYESFQSTRVPDILTILLEDNE